MTRSILCATALVWLAGCESTAPGAAEGSTPSTETQPPPAPVLVDIHVHLFGTGDSGSGCVFSSAITDGPLFKLLTGQLGLKGRADTFDESYVHALVEQMENSGFDRAVLLAQDGVYDAEGKLDAERTHVYVPNEYLFEITERHQDLFVPCVSINPDRADAIEELDRCLRKGARVLKIHPPIQGVDISDPKHEPFFRKCARENVLVMVHTGHEHSAPVVDIELADPRRLKLALEVGCTVVACHCGSGWKDEEPDFFPHFVDMVRRYDKLWGDTSVMGSAKRVDAVRRLLAEKDIEERLLHGSDFPFPSFPVAFSPLIGLGDATRLQSDGNWLRRDLKLKEELGFGHESSYRVSVLLREFGVELSKRRVK